MESLKRGFLFFKQAWRMAQADPDLLKPSFYALLAGLIVTLVGSIPVIVSFVWLGDRGLGQVLAGFWGVVLLFAQLAVGYLFSAMTVYLVYGYLSEGDGKMEKAWAIVRRDWLDLLSLAAASTLVSVAKKLLRGKKNSVLQKWLGTWLETLWTEATYLVLPAMVIEDLNLKDGLKRTAQIVRDNLVLMGISLIGVRLINGLIGFVLAVVGILLGVAAGVAVASLGSGWGIAAGIGLGILVASLFILVAVGLTSYLATAYHTCLFLWARDVEHAAQQGQPGLAVPPAPLAAALEGVTSLSAPLYSD